MDTKWVKDSFEKSKIEVLKFARASKIKIEITSLNKKKDERVKLLGNKVMELIESGELTEEMFEPDYGYIKNIDEEIAQKEAELLLEPEVEEDIPEDELDLVQIESQKVLTADSIPLEPSIEEKPEEKKEDQKDYNI